MNLIGGWTVEFWWFPPKGRRSFGLLWMMPYDGTMHTAILLWVVHIGFMRPWTDEDMRCS